MYVLQKCASTTIAQDVLSCELFRRAIAALLLSATIKASLPALYSIIAHHHSDSV